MRPPLLLSALSAFTLAFGIVPAAFGPSCPASSVPASSAPAPSPLARFALSRLALTRLALVPSAQAQTTTPPPTPAIPPPSNGAPTRGAITTDAPTPSNIPEQIDPDARAGNNSTDPAGPVNSTPFSAGPTGGTGAQISPSLRETEPTNSPSTPELGR